LAADEVSGWSWQLIPSIHDEGAGLKFYEWHSWGYDCIRSRCVSFHFTVPYCAVAFKVLLWSSLCNLSNVIFWYCANSQSVMFFSQDQLSLCPALFAKCMQGSCSFTRASSESISCVCMSYSNRTDIWRWYCRQILWLHHTCTVYMHVLERVHMHIKALQRTWQLSTTNWRKGVGSGANQSITRCGHGS
jgi:hypothetical protein